MDWPLRLQQLAIIALHLILLQWMLFVLTSAGAMTSREVLGHFAGMALYGSGLIRGCAAWGQRRHRIELRQQGK